MDAKQLYKVPEVVTLVQHVMRLVSQVPHLSVLLCDPVTMKMTSQEADIVESLKALGFLAEFGDEDMKGKRKAKKPRRLLWVGLPKEKAKIKPTKKRKVA